MNSWTRIEPFTKEECNNLDCSHYRYHMHNQRRIRCCKYEYFNKLGFYKER